MRVVWYLVGHAAMIGVVMLYWSIIGLSVVLGLAVTRQLGLHDFVLTWGGGYVRAE